MKEWISIFDQHRQRFDLLYETWKKQNAPG
jgi:hypothetical protein